MRKLLVYGLLILFASACNDQRKEEKSKNKPLKAATLVEVVLAEKKELTEYVSTTGELLADEATQLGAEVSGIVNSIKFEEGQLVKKGELLLVLNNQDLQAELKEQKANLSLAEKKLERNRQLYQAKGISKDVLEETETTVESLKAKVQNLEADLGKTQVKAPFDGLVGLRNVSVGDYLAQNNSFAQLVDLKPIKISFALAEKYQNVIKVGDSIQFESPSLSTANKAAVFAVEPMVESASRTIQAKARYSNQDGALIPGGFVTVRYQVEDFDQAILIPNQAIIPELDGKKVYVIKKGKVQAQKVVSGIRRADQIQILEGLNEGDSVVSSGLLQIREGIPVRVRLDKSYEKQASE